MKSRDGVQVGKISQKKCDGCTFAGEEPDGNSQYSIKFAGYCNLPEHRQCPRKRDR